jgi:hypothetical protein
VGRSRGSARRAKIPDVGDDFKQLRRTFDAAADKYHDARPEYPERLFTTLMQVAELRPGDRLSRSAARLWQGQSPACAPGVSHTCLEICSALAAAAQIYLADFPDVDVIEGRLRNMGAAWRRALRPGVRGDRVALD